MAKKKEFVSNVTGEEWHKHNSQRWGSVIHQIGTILEDEIHDGKNGEKLILKKGSRIIIDDIRGRIKPQYRVIDANGKIWFVSALNVDIELNKDSKPSVTEHSYRGGVRHDGNELHSRYEIDKTTEEEYAEAIAKIKKEKEANDA